MSQRTFRIRYIEGKTLSFDVKDCQAALKLEAEIDVFVEMTVDAIKEKITEFTSNNYHPSLENLEEFLENQAELTMVVEHRPTESYLHLFNNLEEMGFPVAGTLH